MEKETSKPMHRKGYPPEGLNELFDTVSEILHKKSVIAIGTVAIAGAALLGLSADHNKENKDPFHGQKYEETEQRAAARGSFVTAPNPVEVQSTNTTPGHYVEKH